MKVLRFDSLLGLETLWRIALTSSNEKVKSEVHELLVDLHLKFDHASQPIEHKQQILQAFIDTCMERLEASDSDAQSKKAAV
jgi:recombinational DNA repair protein (RecF pathway)